jgi:hypothetical protein
MTWSLCDHHSIYQYMMIAKRPRHGFVMIRASLGSHPGFDFWKQTFAEQVSRWPKASSKANQSPDDAGFARMIHLRSIHIMKEWIL